MTTVGGAPPLRGDAGILASYVPRLVENVERSGSDERLLVFEGTLVSADISGFTALSERLAALGHEGSEELTDLLNNCFGQMIAACEQWGGDIIKFGGDALLVLFTEDGHALRATAAMERMRSIVAQPWSTNSVKKVSLGISQGAHAGAFGFSLVDGGHMELLVGGPGVTSTIECEGTAGRGQILLSRDMAGFVPSAWLGNPLPSGARPLRRGLREVGDVDLKPLPSERGSPGLERYLTGPLIEQVLAGNHGEHRQVAVAFVHIGKTDDFFQAHGAQALHEAVQEIAANVREVLTAHEVHLLASDAYENGAKLILTAGAPVSTDADDDRLLLALHELMERPSPLPLRGGANRGHVYVGDLGSTTRRAFTVMGDAVNLAARLMQKSTTGQIVASAALLDRADTRFECEWLEPFMVKGKSKPIEAAVVGAPMIDAEIGAEEAPQDTSAGLFIGRAAEFELLDQVAADAAHGRGFVVEISGEAGIGKSRLVREVLSRRPELRRLPLRGGQYARNSPYFVIRNFLRDLIGIEPGLDAVSTGDHLRRWVIDVAPDLEVWLPLIAIAVGAEVPSTPEVDRIAEEFRRDRVISVVADTVDAAVRDPAALVAEDAHLFDSASTDIMSELARRAASRPWLVMFVSRGMTTENLADVSRHWNLELGPLESADAMALAVEAAEVSGEHVDDRLIERVAERSGGHPLFLLELMSVASAGDDGVLPDSIESLVTTRIDRLPADERLLLREAAVAGRVVDISLIAASFGRPELEVEERWAGLHDFLESRQPGALRFRQELYRAVAYEGLAYRRRREAHLALGATLERRHSDDLAPVAALLSTHFDRGRHQGKAWTYSVLGGDIAREGYANDEAITLYQAALRHAGAEPEHGQVARVAEALGDVCQLSGFYEEARSAYRRSRQAASGDLATQARIQRKIGYLQERQGNHSLALRWYTKAQRSLDGLRASKESTREAAEIALCRAGTLNRQGRNLESAGNAELAAELAASTDDRLGMARAYNILEVAYSTLGRQEAESCARRALELFEGTGDFVGEANVLNNLGVQAYYSGRWDQSIEYYSRSRDLRQKAGDVVGEAMAANNLGEVLGLQGRMAEARELFEHARRRWTSAHFRVGVAYVLANLAMVEARTGDPEAGLKQLDAARQMAQEIGATALRLEMDVKRVECLILGGHQIRALDAAVPLHAELVAEHAGDDEFTTQLELLMALANLRLGRRRRAGDLLDSAAARARQATDEFTIALVALARAELETALGRDPSGSLGEAQVLLERLDVGTCPAVVRGPATAGA